MLEKVFGFGKETRLSDLNQHFYTAIPMIKDNILGSLKTKGMYSLDPSTAQGYGFVGILAMVGIVIGLQYTGAVHFFLDSFVGFAALGVSILIVFLYARV